MLLVQSIVIYINSFLKTICKVNDENLQVSGRMKSDFKYLFWCFTNNTVMLGYIERPIYN